MKRSSRPILLALSLLFVAAPLSSQGSLEARFHRAYFLEREEAKLAEALALYEEIAASAKNASLRDRAVGRAAALTEELASVDFARILPKDAIFYGELNRPGGQLSSLLEQMGLLGTVQDALAKKGMAISPDLVEGLLGIRGAAVAITSVPMGTGLPGGVAVLHPGDVGVLRGLIETAVPVQGRILDPIGGHPTYRIEDKVFVTFSHRLIFVSTSRSEIEACLRRIEDKADDSLAQDPNMRESLAMRGEDLFFLCLNAGPLRPMFNVMLTQQAGGRELAMAQALVDLESFEAVVVRAGVEADGLSMNMALRFDEGHHSLAFHFLRSAELDKRTLSNIPEGAAAFVAAAFNPAGPAIAPLETDADGEPVVTAMDLGRELFANTVGMALFALPDAASGPIPGITLALTTNDAARTQAVFGLLLSVAQVASGSVELTPGTQKIAGRTANVYRVGEGIPIYQMATEETWFVSSSTRALEQTLSALSSGRSVYQDAVFAKHLERMSKGVNQAVGVHGGRVLQIVRGYLDGQEAEVASMVAPMLQGTALSLVSHHSGSEIGFSAVLTGIPKIDGMLSQWLTKMQTQREHRVAEGHTAPSVHSVTQSAVGSASHSLEAHADEELDARQRFEQHVRKQEFERASTLKRELKRQFKDDARGGNNFAWALLTDEMYRGRFDALALAVARAASKADNHSTWQYLDTLALAEFRNGDREAALRYQKKALESVDDRGERRGLAKTLERYRSAKQSSDV